MTSAAKETRSPYYLIICGVAFLGALILVPTPDLITLLLTALITLSAGLVLGLIIRRALPLTRNSRKSQIITAIAVGILGTLICFLVFRLLPYLT